MNWTFVRFLREKLRFKGKRTRSIADNRESQNIIGPDTRVSGQLTLSGSLRIDGIFEGQLDSKNKVVIGEQAKFSGHLRASEASNYGAIKGQVMTQMLTLKSNSKTKADIFTPQLFIELGAQFDGQCNMDSLITASSQEANRTLGLTSQKKSFAV